MLKTLKKILFVILGLFAGGAWGYAQTLSLPYFCGFEDEAENAQWKVVQAKIGKNKWYVGTTAEAAMGLKSLAVSADEGKTASYTNEDYGTIAACRVVTLDPGMYELSFDYKVAGVLNGSDMQDGLYLCLMPDTGKLTVSYKSLSIPQWVLDNTVETFAEDYTWTNYRYAFVVPRRGDYRLAFVWRHNDDDKIQNPAAAIDNVQLGRMECPAPAELNVEVQGESQAYFSWEGRSAKYEVAYKAYDDLDKEILGETTKSEFTVHNLENGVYDFWVRGICGQDTSIWSVYNNVLVYRPEGCIHYIDFHSSQVKAYHGTFADPQKAEGVVDLGFASDSSQHTVHYIPDEYDPRTGGKLKTVPEGKFASVRLGNWRTRSQAEALEYTYTVPEDAGILLLQYAVVLENPNHIESEQPRFTLRMTDEHGNPIENSCGDADFIPGKNTQKWHKYNEVEWKDWTYVGINLQNYIGQKIHVTLTTYDCDQSGHFGYAYFTMDCTDAAFTGLSCADYKADTVWGPMGFNYEWYRKADYDQNNLDNPVSTERYFCPLPSDTTSYVLRNFFIGDGLGDCYLDMTMSLAPRWPVARASYIVNKYDCKNVVTFRNNSYVRTRKGKTNQKIKDFFWDFGNGKVSTVKNPTMVYDKGGSYTVKLYAYLAGGLCEDSVVFTIDLDELYPVSHEYSDYFCEGGYYLLNGEPHFEPGDIIDTLKTTCGCDSVVTLHLSTRPKYNVSVTDSICEGTSYTFGDELLTTTGSYRKRFKTVCGCDSVVVLSLDVAEQVAMDMGDVAEMCADQNMGQLNATVLKGHYDSYQVVFDNKAKAAGFVDQMYEATPFAPINIQLPKNVKADIYNGNIVFEKRLCEPQSFPFSFKVLYPSSVMAQKWNDVVAVKNAQYNGGYEFTGFRWYKNGVLQENQVGSYIYAKDMDIEGAEFVVELQRADGVVLESCPIKVKPVPQALKVYPSRVGRNENVTVEGVDNATYQVWNVTGAMEAQGTLHGLKNTVKVADRPGVYLMHVQTEKEKKVFRIIVE